jgi:hypothetical protein
MHELIVVIWNFHGRGGARAAMAMLNRCDLRHLARQETPVPSDDPDSHLPRTPGSFGSVRLRKDDPRLTALLKELRAAGVKPLTRAERAHDASDLQSEWLCVEGCTTMVSSGGLKDQKWNFRNACPDCGAGAVPVPPLIVRFDGKPPKQGWSVSVPCGLVIVSAALAAALTKARLTGFSLQPVRPPSRNAIDPRFRWLRIPALWPQPLNRPHCRVQGRCSHCDRSQLKSSASRIPILHFDRAPTPARDFGAWQGTVLPRNRYANALNRETGGMPELIISQRAFRVLKDFGVSSLKCSPVRLG